MATLMLDALKNEGKHAITVINSRWAKVMVNGAKLEDESLDNGLLVELDGYDDEGVAKCKAFTGADGKDFFIVETYAEEQLQVDLGETDYKNFYNAKGEMLRLVRHETGLRQETSAYEVAEEVTLAVGLPVEWDATNKKFNVVATSTKAIATVVGVDTDFGFNCDTETIRIEYLK